MRFVPVAIGFGAGVAVGAGGAYIYFGKRPTEQAISPTPPTRPAPASRSVEILPRQAPAAELQYHPSFKFGAPLTDLIRFSTNFVTNVDFRTRNPKWVLEYLTKDTVSGPGDRKQSDFFEDIGIEPRFRAKLSDYRRSGYDRGHMSPASNNKNSQQAMDETFSLSNMTPQVGEGFNRDYWARFEQFVKQLTNEGDAVYVITGPLYLPTRDSANRWRMDHTFIGKTPQLVSVPTHFYKVVLSERKGRDPAIAAFAMPNAPIDPTTPLKATVIPLELLESAAGTKFFPYAINDQQRASLDAAAIRVNAEGRRQLGGANPPLLLPPGIEGTVPAPRPLPNTGTQHLCDAVACQLPAENFWQGAGGGSQAEATARALPRSSSGRR